MIVATSMRRVAGIRCKEEDQSSTHAVVAAQDVIKATWTWIDHGRHLSYNMEGILSPLPRMRHPTRPLGPARQCHHLTRAILWRR